MEQKNDAIRNVLSLYAHHFDSRNLPAWIDLFTDDVEWKVFAGDQLRTELHGRNNLEQFWQRERSWSPSDGVTGRHVVVNVAILNRDDASAHVAAYGLVVSAAAERGFSTTATGQYQGELVKEAGHWRIKRWIVTLDQYPR